MYRIEAESYEDALTFILSELKPSPDAEAVIRTTLRQEQASEPPPGSYPLLPDDDAEGGGPSQNIDGAEGDDSDGDSA